MLDVDKAIVFAEREGYRALELDLYRDVAPRTASLLPLVVFVHGGGWRVGHRRAPRETREWERRVLRAALRRRLRRRGRAATASAARRSSRRRSTTWSTRCAGSHDHGAEHRASNPIGRTCGVHPAGGTLAALAALVPAAPAVRGAVIWYAVSDFLALDLEATDNFEAHLFGGPIGEHLELAPHRERRHRTCARMRRRSSSSTARLDTWVRSTRRAAREGTASCRRAGRARGRPGRRPLLRRRSRRRADLRAGARVPVPARRRLRARVTWEPELDELRRRTEMAKAMGGPDKVARQHEFGKLTVRERVERLVDAGLVRRDRHGRRRRRSTTRTAS